MGEESITIKESAINDLVAEVRQGKPRAMARALDVIESEGQSAARLVEALGSHVGDAHRIGITGPPGVGKSTFANQLVKQLRAAGKAVGIIAVDPSSPFTGGALFGDRLRMCDIADDSEVFIRSMATHGDLGGLTRRAWDAADVLDAAGKDCVILETVGVGQMELDIMAAADTIIVMTIPGTGDMVQSMKSGIMEIGDIFIINKADLPGAETAASHIESMLRMQVSRRRWHPVARLTDAIAGTGVGEVLMDLKAHRQYLQTTGTLLERRLLGAEGRIRRLAESRVIQQFWTKKRLQKLKDEIRKSDGRISPHAAVRKLFDLEP